MGPPPLQTGQRKLKRGPRFLGRYELIGELARGGMGTVYLARHAGEAGFQRLFAIKVLHPHLAEEPGFVDMLRDEGRIAARIHHPNVVAVVDLGTSGTNHYVVMDYVEGPTFGTLYSRTEDKRPINLVVSVMIDTLEGLHAAHTLKDDDGDDINLVHRDVSPQNILVGVDGVARITDFGIAKAETRIASTQPGTRKGKLQFMSPEQVRNPEKIDLRTDVWAAGVVLWSMLTAKHLFKAENDAATLHNLLSKEIVPPSKEDEGAPACLDDIVLKALQRDPTKRFESALEMADALRQAAAANGLLGSRQAVAAWVTEICSRELERRRVAIRELAKHRVEHHEVLEASQVTMLNLPSMTGSISVAGGLPSPELGDEVGEDLSGEEGSVGSLSGDLPDVPSFSRKSSTTPAPIPITPSAGARRWTPAFVAAALLVGAIVVVLFGFGEKDEADTASQQTVARPAAAPAAANPAPAVEQASAATADEAPPPEAAEPSASSTSTAAAKEAKQNEKPRRVVRAARAVAAAAAPASSSATEKAPAAEAPQKAPPPLPTPTPQQEFEKNPYLRR